MSTPARSPRSSKPEHCAHIHNRPDCGLDPDSLVAAEGVRRARCPLRGHHGRLSVVQARHKLPAGGARLLARPRAKRGHGVPWCGPVSPNQPKSPAGIGVRVFFKRRQRHHLRYRLRAPRSPRRPESGGHEHGGRVCGADEESAVRTRYGGDRLAR